MHTALEAIFKRALAAAAGVDLGFDDHARIARVKKFYDRRLRFVEVCGRFARRHLNAVAFHQLFGLIFVEIHT